MAFAYSARPGVSHNDSHLNNSSNPGDGGIELYSTVACSFLLLGFGVMGTLANLALLLSARCKRSIRRMEYAIPYALATTDLLLCSIWVPLELSILLLNFFSHPVIQHACYLRIVLFYFLISIVIFLNVSIGLQRFLISISVKWAKTTFPVAAIFFSILFPGISTFTIVMEYRHTIDFTICTQHWLILPISSEFGPVWMKLISLQWIVSFICVSLSLGWIIKKHRVRLNPPPLKPPKIVSEICSDRGSRSRLSYRSDMDEPSEFTSREDSRFQVSEHSSSSRGDNKPTKGSSKNLTSTDSVFSKPFLFGLKARSKPGSGDESDMDDDEFDRKMKLKLQKSLSGRRHTVANIGSSSDNPETSLFGGPSKGPFTSKASSANPRSYAYVRKWSVDITALQDQLENPKSHNEISNPFSDLQKFREKMAAKEDKIVEEHHEEASGSSASSPKKNKTSATGSPTTSLPQAASTPSPTSPTTTTPVVANHNATDANQIKKETSADLTPNDDTKASQPNQHKNGDKVKNNSTATSPCNEVLEDFKTKTDENGGKKVTNVEDAKETNEDIAEEPDEDQKMMTGNDADDVELTQQERKSLVQEMQTTTVCLLLALVVTLCCLPYAILQLVRGWIHWRLGYNVNLIAQAFCLVQTPVHPLLLAWMERRIWQALRRLRLNLSHLRCVCYCNIGKDRECFGKPHYNGKSTSPTAC